MGVIQKLEKKRYFNADGSLNYRGIKKERHDKTDKDPYGHRNESGRYSRTAEQANRKTFDTIKYGIKGVQRIEDKVRAGHGYYKAKRAEDIRSAARGIIASASTYAYIDLAFNDGKAIRSAAKATAFTGKKIINNAAGLLSKIPLARINFDNKMLDDIFK